MAHGYSTGATFVPGGDDSYYMPELVSPAPQRVLSEVPGQIQNNITYLEQQASGRGPANSSTSRQPYQAQTHPSPGDVQAPFPNDQHHNSSSFHPQELTTGRYGAAPSAPSREQPNFSPFPVLRNPPPNVPPTDEQKEATLEAAREAVLSSNDPETQLTWAQDALLYVEIAMQNEQRVSATQTARSRTPRIEHVLREDAMKVVEFLADQHHPRAEFIRGMWLEFGKFGQRIDKKEAFYCYSRAADRGYHRAEYRIGMQFETSNEPLKAIKYYQRGADAGDSACCYRLGMMTLLGQHGQPQDYDRGLNLIYSSAETADENAPQGAYVFGMLQARQLPQVDIPLRFLPTEIASAKMNIEKAAFLGFAKAQVKIGSAYELCELGCEFSPALSLHYNALAARQGEAEAEMAISKWFLCGHEGLFEKNEEIAFTYAQRAAVGGSSVAQFAMGYFYEVGIYVPVNFPEAKEWYSRASGSGNKDAKGRVDSISRSKTLSRRDHERMAVSRIRQQHGSHGEQLQSVSEDSAPLDMPDPTRLSLGPGAQAQQRPPSAAPYPAEPNDLRPNLYGQSSNLSNPERPTSAFGINPNLRPPSAANGNGNRPGGYGRGMGSPQQRPYLPHDPYKPAPSRGRGMRYSSGPAPAPLPPPGRGQPRPASTSPYLGPHTAAGTPPAPPPKANIGFVASEESYPRPLPPGSDQFMRKPQTPRPNGRLPQPLRDDRYGSDRPPHGQSNSSQEVQPVHITPSQPSNMPAEPAPAKPAQVSANTKIPGKGPQTFAEMGVPVGKQQSECIIM